MQQDTPQDTEKTPFLIEAAWEVCNQVGGIYTVIRSKIPATVQKWKSNYCLLGPYNAQNAAAEFEPFEELPDDAIGRVVQQMKDEGYEVHYGKWLVTGQPKVVLFNLYSAYPKLGDIKYFYWKDHNIELGDDNLVSQVMALGFLFKIFIQKLAYESPAHQFITHFHEWMAGTAIPDLRRSNTPVTIVFTTHATLLGRYLAMNDPEFYRHLPWYDWEKEAHYFNVMPQVKIERAAAHGAQVFTTVSDVTARECVSLLGRQPDLVLPNGFNIERFTALHEFQNLHKQYKEKIHEFVIGHFFPSYSFDLDRTIYFFTSGRYEYRNKGFDITLEALARLNWMLRINGIDKTVVMFFITKRPYHTINPDVLQSRAMMAEIRTTLDAMQKQVSERLFYKVASSNDYKLPTLNDLIDDYWKLRLRRTLQNWKSSYLPTIVTHNIVNDSKDEILNFLRNAQLINNEYDKVKVVYHPDFVSPTSPLFGMEYGQFVRGCHLGIFPSYYEPWGYTPLECIASGVPTITSDLSGFGDYVLKNMEKSEEKGIYVVNRSTNSYQESANQLAEYLFAFVQQGRRERITQRNQTESASEGFDWKHLTAYYDKAYQLALERC